jgi:hypothetical protein
MKIFTERDNAVLHDLEMVPFMTASQIFALHWPGTFDRSFRRRMAFLVESGKVQKLTLPFATGGRPEYGYSVKKIHGHVILPHMIDIAWTYVRFTQFCRTYGYSLEEWNRPTKRNAAGLIPDAVFVIRTDKRPFRFMTEVDRGTEPLMSPRENNDIKKKFEKYETYLESGEYEKEYGDKKGRVLFIVPSLKRLQNIKSICEKVNVVFLKRYWFCVMGELKAYDVFFKPIWQHAGSEETHSLIEGA